LVDILIEDLRVSLGAVFETEGGKDLLEKLLSKEIAPYEAAKVLAGQSSG